MCLVAVLHTLPLLTNLSAVIPGRDLGDNAAFIWNLWWMREASRLGTSFFHSEALMAPHGADLALHTHTALQGWLGATVLGQLTAVQAQNVLLVASLALNGASVYALALEAGTTRSAAATGGLLFVVAPQIALRLMGHFNLVAVWPLAFACWAFVRAMRRPTILRGGVLGMLAALVAYGDYYFLVFFGMFAAVYLCTELWESELHAVRRTSRAPAIVFSVIAGLALVAAGVIAVSGGGTFAVAGVDVRATSPTNTLTTAWLAALAAVAAAWQPSLAIRRRTIAMRAVLTTLAVAGIVAAIALAPLAFAMLDTLRTGGYVTQDAGLRSGPQGVDLLTFVLGPPFHGLAGPAIRALYERLGINVMEASGWIGATVAILGLLSLRAWRDREHRRWVIIGVVFLLWALGPYLIIAGSNTGALLPQAIARYIPFVNNARMPGRAMIVVSMVASVLAARYLSGKTVRIAALVAAVGLAEAIAAPVPVVAVPVSSAHAALAAINDPGGVLPVPFGMRDGFGAHGLLDHSTLYFQTQHRRPIAGGFVARLPPRVAEWYDTREPYHTLMVLGDNPGARPASPSCELMKEGLDQASIAFVVVNRRLTSPPMQELLARMPLTPIAHDEQFDVLRVVSCTERSP